MSFDKLRPFHPVDLADWRFLTRGVVPESTFFKRPFNGMLSTIQFSYEPGERFTYDVRLAPQEDRAKAKVSLVYVLHNFSAQSR